MTVYIARFGNRFGQSFISKHDAMLNALGLDATNKILDNCRGDHDTGYRPITRYYAANDHVIGFIERRSI